MPQEPTAETPAMFEDPTAVQLRVTLLDIKPRVWRRLIVPITFNLVQLHNIIQAAFGWKNYHLHHFNVGGLHYGDAELAEEARIDDLLPRVSPMGRNLQSSLINRFAWRPFCPAASSSRGPA